MAGVSTKEIKTRIRSMESTRQITKAMEMVATSKLRKAQSQVLAARPYFEALRDTLDNITASDRDFSSPYLQNRPVKKTAYIVIAGDRGLAGGYTLTYRVYHEKISFLIAYGYHAGRHDFSRSGCQRIYQL